MTDIDAPDHVRRCHRGNGRRAGCRPADGARSVTVWPGLVLAFKPFSPDGNQEPRFPSRFGRQRITGAIVFTPHAAAPPPTYSQAVEAAGLVFVSGTAPADPATGAMTGDTIQEQTRQCLINVRPFLRRRAVR